MAICWLRVSDNIFVLFLLTAAIGGFYAHAEGAAKNDRNCLNLYRLVRFVERQLHHLQGMEEKYAKDEDVKSSVKDLLVSIHEASKVVRRFVGRKFVLKMLLSSSDDAKFTRLDASINKSIAAISFVVSMQLSVRDEPAYISADSQELKAAIMDEAGLTAEERSAPDCMQIAIAKLSSTPEGKKKLKDLIREHRKETLSITEDHLMREIDGIQAQLKEFRDLAVHIEHQMDFIGASVHMLLLIASERSASSSLSVFLADWWKKAFKFKRSTRDGTKALPWKDFCNILLDGNGVAEGVAIIDRELRALMTAENIDVEEVSSIVSVNCGKEGISIVSIFLSCVLRPLLLHSEATVSQSSLVRLMAIVDEWCQKEKAGDISQAKDWDSFLALIFRVSPLSMLKPVLVKKHLSVMLPSPLPRRRTMPRSQTRAKAISSSQAQAIRVQPTHLIESEPSHSSVAKCDLFSEAVASAVDDLRRSNEEIIESYHISDVLAEYVKGTRQWLLNELMSWMNEETASSDAALDRKSALAVKESEGADKEEATGAVDLMGRHLMFVLVASPGMGKSVFSALVHTKLTAQEFYHQEEGGEGSEEIKRTIVVSHFFKAGQKRAQGLSMIISLASQLADKLGGAMASSFSASIGSRAEFQVVKKELDDLNKAKKDLEAVLSNVKEKTKANITAMTRQLEERARRVVNEGALEKDIYESEQTKVKLEREEAELGSRLKEVEMRLAELLEVLKANPWIDLEDLENAADM